MPTHKFDSIAIVIILVAVFLLPIFFIPLLSVSFQFTKSILLIATVFLALIFWIVARLKSSQIMIPRSLLLLAGALIPSAYLFSSLFSGNILHSLVGQGFDTDTFITMIVMFVVLFLASNLFVSSEKIIHLYFVLAISAAIFAFFQILRLIYGVDFLSFNIFTDATSNLLGKWNDVAIFFGLTTILSAITIDSFRPKYLLSVILYGILAIFLFLLVVVNFSTVWPVLALFSGVFLVRSFFTKKITPVIQIDEDVGDNIGDGDNTVSKSRFKLDIPKATLIVFIISIVFILSGDVIGSNISAKFDIFQIEARPSWQSTFDIMKISYSDSIFFGTGPNNFTKEWLLNKPDGINVTPFWNIDFNSGIGIVPTSFITTGILGAFSWFIFFGLFLLAGFRTFMRLNGSHLENYLASSSFFSALFLWIFTIFYTPSILLLFFAFLFTGIFLAVQQRTNIVSQKLFQFENNPRLGIVWVIVLVSILLGSVVSLYIVADKFTSSVYLQNAIIIANQGGDIEKARKNISMALKFDDNDNAYRVSSGLSVMQMSKIIAEDDGSAGIQDKFQIAFSLAIQDGQKAVDFDGKNYQNLVSLARVYDVLIPLKIEGAYENSKAVYERAIELNPNNPYLYLQIARADVLNGNNISAREKIAKALKLKNNYTDAIFLLSQIEMNEGNVDAAISSVEAASFLAPNDPLVFFQLGLLRYSKNNYSGSIEALERAVVLNPSYSNARYFLGLSYYQLGRASEAVEQFELISKLNPNNTEVKSIIRNIMNDRAPFENLESQPDPIKDRETLPIKE